MAERKSKDHPLVAEIIELRNSMDGTEFKEQAHESCKGMYRCSKTADEACLKEILKKLKALAKTAGIKGGCDCAATGGRARRSRSKSPKGKRSTKKRSKSRSR